MDYLPAVVAVVVMGVAGILDLLYREIEPLYWFYATLLGGLAYLKTHGGLLGQAEPILLGLALAPALVMAGLYAAGLMGGADVLAMVFLSLAYPLAPGSLLPVPVLAILYASPLSVAHRIWMLCRVVRGPRCLVSGRIRVPGYRLLSDPRLRWWLVSDKRAGGLDVGGETWEIVAKLGPREPVEATPGLPYVTHLAAGTILAVILGDDPVLGLVELLAGRG
ncbi:MAG: hypothetical protein GSR84_00135 [Desulfurococcales archaeon]|nr:hypothetical protein [Desulfurococcales archaeon]